MNNNGRGKVDAWIVTGLIFAKSMSVVLVAWITILAALNIEHSEHYSIAQRPR